MFHLLITSDWLIKRQFSVCEIASLAQREGNVRNTITLRGINSFAFSLFWFRKCPTHVSPGLGVMNLTRKKKNKRVKIGEIYRRRFNPRAHRHANEFPRRFFTNVTRNVRRSHLPEAFPLERQSISLMNFCGFPRSACILLINSYHLSGFKV